MNTVFLTVLDTQGIIVAVHCYDPWWNSHLYERGVFACPPVGPPLGKPYFLTFLVSLKNMETLRSLVVILLQAIH